MRSESTFGITDEYISDVIRYLDPDLMKRDLGCRMESESPVSLAIAVVLVIAIALSFVILIWRV